MPYPTPFPESVLSLKFGMSETSKQKVPADDEEALALVSYRDYSNAPAPASDSSQPKYRGGISTHFPEVLHAMLTLAEVDEYDSICSWEPHGRAFAVHSREKFVKKVLPRFFRQSHFASFQRQLNLYGFQRLSSSSIRRSSVDKDPTSSGDASRSAVGASAVAAVYYHPMFLRTRHDLCLDIQRATEKEIREKKRGRVLTLPDPDFSQYPELPRSAEEHVEIARKLVKSQQFFPSAFAPGETQDLMTRARTALQSENSGDTSEGLAPSGEEQQKQASAHQPPRRPRPWIRPRRRLRTSKQTKPPEPTQPTEDIYAPLPISTLPPVSVAPQRPQQQLPLSRDRHETGTELLSRSEQRGADLSWWDNMEPRPIAPSESLFTATGPYSNHDVTASRAALSHPQRGGDWAHQSSYTSDSSQFGMPSVRHIYQPQPQQQQQPPTPWQSVPSVQNQAYHTSFSPLQRGQMSSSPSSMHGHDNLSFGLHNRGLTGGRLVSKRHHQCTFVMFISHALDWIVFFRSNPPK